MNLLGKVKEDPFYLQNLSEKDQTPELCLAAVQECGDALQYVKNKTPEICLAAVQTNWWSIEYVEEQTLTLCLEAFKCRIEDYRCISEDFFNYITLKDPKLQLLKALCLLHLLKLKDRSLDLEKLSKWIY
jgi:hypothetical protein